MSKIIKTVKTDDLSKLNYYPTDVLFNTIEKKRRKLLLEKACRKGNSYYGQKARIVFASKSGIKKIEARVISLTKTTITLKGLNSLPIKSIIGVEVDVE